MSSYCGGIVLGTESLEFCPCLPTIAALGITHCASEDGESQGTAAFSLSPAQESKAWVRLLHCTVMSLAHALQSRSSVSLWEESPAWVIPGLDSEVRSGCSRKELIVGLCRPCLMLLPSLSLRMMKRERVCATRTGGISAGVRSLGVVTVRLEVRTAVFYLW